MQLTIKLRLRPTSEQAEVLLETIRQYTECFNAVCSYGWQHRESNGVRLHHATYRSLRARFPALPARFVISARERAREALRSAFVCIRRGMRVSQPSSRLCPIRYDPRAYVLRITEAYVSLASVVGRIKVSTLIDPHARDLLNKAVDLDSADLIYRKGEFWFHVVLTVPEVRFRPSGVVVGVDLGVVRPAVCSNNRFFGEKRWREIEQRYFRLRRSLQRKGTRSAKRHLRKLADKVNRFRRDCDHVVSRRIVDSVQPGTVIVVENLAHIRDRAKLSGRKLRRRFHSWSFARLRAFLLYKAEAKGCRVEVVDPHQTSQICSRCGHVHRSNRRSQSRFLCRACGFELNADLNAARNIVRKYLASSATRAAGGPLSTGLSYESVKTDLVQAPGQQG